ncbi:MAG: hypothetical protein PHC46_04490 [Clostridia bacterium]|nr:hypothetical protein [Clostridia bacterium]
MEFWYKGEWKRIINKKEVNLLKALLKSKNLIVVVGEAGIGKSVFCKNMSTLNEKAVYCEAPNIDDLDKDFREKAYQCIELKYTR